MRTPKPTASMTAPPRMPRPPVIPRTLGSLPGEQAFEPGQWRALLEPDRHRALQRFAVFQAAASIDDEHVLMRVDEALLRELARALERGRTLGADEHPFAHAGEPHHRRDLFITDCD